jgi:eukaryotic-like serine/threonine-protein kinase
MPSDPRPASPLDPPRQIGRCELFAPLARGGMATVHLGRWLGEGSFRKIVAVKALHPELARDSEFTAMFLDEARIVARIRHPNVMPTLDVVEQTGELFIVMDYLEGATLAALANEARERGRAIPVPIVKRILAGVLHGLHAAHEAKDERGRRLDVIHRDVAPDNIMIGTDGYARMIDFGIAKAAGRSTQTRTGMIKGKIAYLAPEQLLEEPLSRRTDVYGAAVVGWQLLTGHRLFEGESAGELAMKIVRASIVPPSEFEARSRGERRTTRPASSDAAKDDESCGDGSLDYIIMRGLARDADARWPTAEAMADAIEESGQLASHREVGDWVRLLAEERLGEIRRLVEAIERAPVVAPVVARSMRRGSIPDVEPVIPHGEIEGSRTDVTSEASAAPAAPTNPFVGALIAAILVGAVVATALGLRRPPDPPAPATVILTAPPPPEPPRIEPAPTAAPVEEALPAEVAPPALHTKPRAPVLRPAPRPVPPPPPAAPPSVRFPSDI